VFKRRTPQPPQATEEDLTAEPAGAETERVRPGQTPKKAAPTPKRSEAQAQRRQPYQAPADRKSASRGSRDQNRLERQRRAQALQRGEQWALPAKDRGPVRALARDYVDARHGLGEYFLFSVLILIVLLVIPSESAKLISDAVVLAVLVLLGGEAWWVGRRVERLAKERFPGESTRGVKLYVAQRGIMVRRMRVPKPKVNRGDKV
jgi:hypothetical protein